MCPKKKKPRMREAKNVPVQKNLLQPSTGAVRVLDLDQLPKWVKLEGGIWCFCLYFKL